MRRIEREWIKPFEKNDILENIERDFIEVRCPRCCEVIKIPANIIANETEKKLDMQIDFINNELEKINMIMRDTGISEYQRQQLQKALEDMYINLKKNSFKIIK